MNAPALFRTKAQDRAVISLMEGVRDGQALLALTGPDGVGKTVVLDAAVELLARQGVRVRRPHGPEGETFGLPHLIGELLGTSAGAVEDDDIEQLFETLTAVDCPSRLVLVFDDAQALGTDVLRYMQMVFSLKGLGISHHQVVFVGRPEFWEKLASSGCGALGEQIGVRGTLEPLSEEEAGEYMNARLLAMDGAGADILTRPALTAIVQRAGGRPGRINAILETMLTGCVQSRPHLLTSSAVNRAAAALRDAAGAEPFAVPPAPALRVLPGSIRLASAPSVGDPAASDDGPTAMRQGDDAVAVAPRSRTIGPGLRHVPWRRGAVVLTITLLVPGAAGVWHSARLAQPFAPPGLAASPAAAPIAVAADEQTTDTQTTDAQTTDAQTTDTQTGTTAEEGTPVPTKPGATGAGSTDDQAAGPGTASEAAMPPPTAEGKPASPRADAVAQPALPAGAKPESPAETAGAGTPQDKAARAAAGAEPASPSAPAAAPAPTAGATHAPAEPAADMNPPARSEPKLRAPAIDKAADAPNPEVSPPPPAAAQAAPAGPASSAAAPPPAEAATPPPAPVPANPVPETAATKPPDVPAQPPAQPAAARMVPAQTSLSADTIAELLKRGDAMLAVGDISAARLFYVRAAEGGSAQAAMRVGKTYDPAFLSRAGVRGMPTDSAAAASWYRKAAALGDPEAAGELKRLSGGP